MNVSIRILGPGDSHLLRNVADDVFDLDIDPAYLDAYLDVPNHMLCVALIGNLVVGQARAVVHSHPDKADELYIDNVGVDPAYQRRGYARRMLELLFDTGRERGCRETWVSTEADNEPAKALYRSLGLDVEPMVCFEGRMPDDRS